MYGSLDDRNIITAVSSQPFELDGRPSVLLKSPPTGMSWEDVVGLKVFNGEILMSPAPMDPQSMRIAVVCNWNDRCGISTYSKFLVEALIPKIKEVRVFSEVTANPTGEDEPFVERCWKRGESLKDLCDRVDLWKPDMVIIQHEFGIFPNACHYMKLMQRLDSYPTLLCMHSVYTHLDKAVCASVAKNILVHTTQGEACLRSTGNSSNVFVVPHGCVEFPDAGELWNIFQNPYTIFQFGFGFRYKGVERVLEAVSLLKQNDPKFKDIFYQFMLSTNGHNDRANDEYYEELLATAKKMGVEENVAIIRKFSSDQMLNYFLRTFKLAVFPYVVTPDNAVFGSSGALKVAMANGIPVIASDSHLFDDVEGVVPRPGSAESLAAEIDRIFSDGTYRSGLLAKAKSFIESNNWPQTADRYLAIYPKLAV